MCPTMLTHMCKTVWNIIEKHTNIINLYMNPTLVRDWGIPCTAVSLGNEIEYLGKCEFYKQNPVFGGKNNIHGVSLYIVIEKKV